MLNKLKEKKQSDQQQNQAFIPLGLRKSIKMLPGNSPGNGFFRQRR
jgi:hypothetical protein